MTQVNFYALPDSEPQARLQFVCRLTEKAYSLGHRVHILVDSPEQSKYLDELLWQFSPGSFIPHRRTGVDSVPDHDEPVTVGTDLDAAAHGDVLINLGQQPCELASPFNRINEVISADEESKEQGRNRYRFYRDKAYQIETFKL